MIDILFYAIIGLVTVPFLVLIVSLCKGTTYEQARLTLKSFLQGWADFASPDFIDKVFKTAGITTTLFLLGFVAYTANRVGDATLPHTAAVFSYFKMDKVEWSVVHEQEWKEAKWDFRETSGIDWNRLEWERTKAELGKYDVRFFRTIAVMFFVLAIAGLVGLLKRGKRIRGLVAMLAALLALTASHFLWAERQDQYIENLMSRYMSEYMSEHGNPPPMPNSYPGHWVKPTCE